MQSVINESNIVLRTLSLGEECGCFYCLSEEKMPWLVKFWVLCGLEDRWSFRQYLMGQNKSQK